MPRIRFPLATAGLALGVVAAGCMAPADAGATEGGASLYLLGAGGPGAAILPPLEGIFLVNSYYHYEGEASRERQFQLGGNVVGGLKANIDADFPTVVWVPTTNAMGGATLALGLIVPVGVPDVNVDVVLTGPRGRAVTISRQEDRWTVGDPVLNASLAWKSGDVWIQTAALLNIPIGDYAAGHLANLSFNRLALDTSLAVTWRKAGWDLSGKTGVTFNGSNPSTDYNSGDEWHVEASIEKTLSPAWSLGVQAYYLSQISGDSGTGDLVGPFKGQVTGVGATAAYNFKIAGKIPATLRARAFTEMDAKNRLEGDSFFLDFSMPLWVPNAPR
jgi:hypothetical protein